MGIEDLHFLIDPDASPKARAKLRTRKLVEGKVALSRHVVVSKDATKKWVFGWDQPLQSFYLQVHDMTRSEDDEENPRITTWLGADKDTIMYEVEDLVQAARKHGLAIDHSYRVKLYGEKDDGA